MWQCIYNAIERSLYKGEGLSGFALDLSKAYNSIPRDVLFSLMDRLGFPKEFVNAYAMPLFLRVFNVCSMLLRIYCSPP